MGFNMKSFNSLLLSLFVLFYTTNAFNITKILEQHPDFSTFNNYLSQTQLAAAVNSRQTITILAVDNAGISALSGKPADELKKIMSVHVVLDYFDEQKLKKLSKKTSLLTTLFQSSGQAIGQQGFVNVSDLSSGSVVFGSAVKGSSLDSNLVKSVVAQPYNISVLQISSVIVPTGIDGSTNSTAAKTPKASPGPAPAKSPKKSPPAGAPEPSEAASPPDATADSPSPKAGDVPVGSPTKTVDADAPAAESPADGGDKKSGGEALRLGVSVVLGIAVSTSFIGLVF